MPSDHTVRKWLSIHPDFLAQYTHAREAQADAMFDKMLEIAAVPKRGEKVKTTSDGKQEITTGDMVDRDRLHVDTLKWALARMAPRKYGDASRVEHSGNIAIKPTEEMTDDELAAIVASARSGSSRDTPQKKGSA